MDEGGVRIAIGSGESGGGRAGDLLVNREFKPLRGIFGKSVGGAFLLYGGGGIKFSKDTRVSIFYRKISGESIDKIHDPWYNISTENPVYVSTETAYRSNKEREEIDEKKEYLRSCYLLC